MTMHEDNNKRRAVEPAIGDRSTVDMDQLKSFILAQNHELQEKINNKLQETIETNNKASFESLEVILDKKLNMFSGYVDSKIESVRTECMSTIKEISSKMTNNMCKFNNDVEDRLDYLERQTKLCDVVIKNIPYRQDENMEYVVYDICDAIEYKNTGAIKSAFRLSKNQNKSNPIIMKFYDIADKRHFMEAYFQHPHLNLTNVGFQTKLRIVICEALTQKNQQIFQRAMHLKFNKVFSSVSTNNGFVYYRTDHKSRAVKILSISSLDAFYKTGANKNDEKQTPVENANALDHQPTPTTLSSLQAANLDNAGQVIDNGSPMETINDSAPKTKNTDVINSPSRAKNNAVN